MPEPLPTHWPSRSPRLRGIGGSEALDLAQIMSAVGEVAFAYDASTNSFAFDAHAVDLLGVSHPRDIQSAAAFMLRIAPDYRQVRLQAAGAPGPGDNQGRSYTTQYPFLPMASVDTGPIYVEEQGQWTKRSDGTLVSHGVMRVITSRFLEQDRQRERGTSDYLTGLLNRETFSDVLSVAITDAIRTRKTCALLVVSVSALGSINKTFGIQVGDEVLLTVARLLRRNVRRSDAVGRYGSNKFAILLGDIGPGTMRLVADRLVSRIGAAIIETSTAKLTTSIRVGAVALPAHAQTAQAALPAALEALDRARSKTVDTFVAYEPRPLEDNLKRRNAMIADGLICALQERRMSLELQPMVATRSGQPDHYECLLRMTREDGVIVSAGEFMPIAEQLGLARNLDLRAQELTIDLLRRYPGVSLALNVSGLTATDDEWLLALHRLSQGKREILHRLTVEITETAAIRDLEQTIDFVATIKGLGCKVAIDDFGVGYTNFRNLKVLNADLVKIDGVFVRNVCHDKGDQVFVRAMVELARAFEMQTVAEWVGDAETATFLTDAGIDYLQGYHFGAPDLPEKLLGPPAL